MAARPMRHGVFEEPRADIMSRALQPGGEFRESGPGERHGVAKSPLRDVLRRLEVEGPVEIIARRGRRVGRTSIADGRDILDFRGILQAAAMRGIATDATDDAPGNRTSSATSQCAFGQGIRMVRS